MVFDMGEVFGIRRETGREEPAWLMCDDATSLAIRDVAIDFLRIREDDDMITTEELGSIAEIARDEGVLEDEVGMSRTVLFIRQLDLAREVIDAENFREFFDLVPRACFLLHNVRPDLLCYLVAERDGYYDEAAASALLDPRSVDGYSPLLYADCGFKLDKSGSMLYRLVEL